MKKLILKLDLEDDRAKQKAMNAVTELSGIDSLAIDMKERILTVIGTADPIGVVRKLRKHWATEIISVGPVKEAEPVKKEEAKKEGENKEEIKAKEVKKEEVVKKGEPVKDEGKGNEVKKEEQKKKEDEKKADHVFEMAKHYRSYNPHMTSYYHAPSMEDNPNSCVIT